MEMDGRKKAGQTDKKRLLVTASTFPRWEGDTEPRFILDLSAHLTEYFDVTVLAPAAPGAKTREVMGGVKVIRYHYFPIHRLETLCYPGAIASRIREKKTRILLVPFLFFSLWFWLWKLLPDYDLVHAHWLIPQGIVQSLFRTPYVVTGHGADVTTLNRGFVRRMKIRCLKRASGVSVVAEHLSARLQKMVPGLSPQVVSMGVCVRQFQDAHGEAGYFGQGRKKVVLFVGRLAEKKGVTYLIEAMRFVDAMLAVVGEGPLAGTLKRQAADLKEKVLFLGPRDHEQLRTIYHSADLLAVPSVTAGNGEQEGLPTVILEAMASGLPVVASRTGGAGALIRNGETGLLCEEGNVFQLADCINRLLGDETLCRKISRQAQAEVSAYDYTVIAKRYQEILRSCIPQEMPEGSKQEGIRM